MMYCQKTDIQPICTGCGAREFECWETCGKTSGFCGACTNGRGDAGACCRLDTDSDGAVCAFAHANWHIDDGYHTCVIVDAACGDPAAANYVAGVANDPSMCVYAGCIDASASNFNPGASVSDGSCTYGACTWSTLPNSDPSCPDCVNFPGDMCWLIPDCEPDAATGSLCDSTNINNCGNYDIMKCMRDCYAPSNPEDCLSLSVQAGNAHTAASCKGLCSETWGCEVAILEAGQCTLSSSCIYDPTSYASQGTRDGYAKVDCKALKSGTLPMMP